MTAIRFEILRTGYSLSLQRRLKEYAYIYYTNLWLRDSNALGWQNLDIRYGGVISRCDTAIEFISEYLSGNLDKIEELEEPRLHKSLSGFIQYNGISTVNLKT